MTSVAHLYEDFSTFAGLGHMTAETTEDELENADEFLAKFREGLSQSEEAESQDGDEAIDVSQADWHEE